MSPLVNSKYTSRPFYLCNRHLESVLPSIIFRSGAIDYRRERLEMKDGDFLDLDWIKGGHQKLMVLSHGLEGSTTRYYMTRMARYFSDRKWDILAWNARGCSGVMNRNLVLIHHGYTVDLEAVIQHALKLDYTEIVLVGLSMGGCQSIKYLCTKETDKRIKGAVGFSITGDMEDMITQVEKKENRVYKSYFMSHMKDRLKKLALLHPDKLDVSSLDRIRSFEDFHLNFTIPINRFSDLQDFYFQSSLNNFLPNLTKPALIVNALNDPILGPRCHPVAQAKNQPNLDLELSRYGGHLGFNFPVKSYSYMEIRTESFISEKFGD